MSLGERIGQYRRSLGVSQEELGARLGVSRQAVSKWETNAATPDMTNLIALAKEFGVSVAELTETPEQPKEEKPSRENLRLFLFPILIVLLTLVLFSAGSILWSNFQPDTSPSAAPPPKDAVSTGMAVPSPVPTTDFALIWTGSNGDEEFLELGTQEDFFPFGTSLELTAPEEVLDTDFGSMTAHRADCGAVFIEYSCIEDTPEPEGATRKWENIDALSTIVPGYATPRGITSGSSEADLLAAYGDELVYCLKEEGYTLVPHDCFYAWSAFADGYSTIFFFVERGNVSGIRMERMYDLGDYYTPDNSDNIYRFPMKNGEPDFSLREEPEQEEVSDTRRVYIAFNQLVTNNNLTAEERYAYRRDIFTLLPNTDWTGFGQMGTAEYPSDSIFALMDWLQRQDTYTESEIFWIQAGSVAKGIDGAYAESYDGLLSRVFFYDPVNFIRNLTHDLDSEEDWRFHSVLGAAFDGVWYPQELAAARETLNTTLSSGMFTPEESGWCRLMLLYLEAAERDNFGGLPHSPSELP
ncbi:MAG: helix-turn-helix transcriptional regulator [Dysosmobacter sp.]|uniref:helix-turn-helix domain-containing protein n=1 Tax=uncultured Oscillibacter sp. TaxID=876091 RepID=UPI0026158C77|nr:helix-turn-helix transcriptional regulator [uncultured Oscillibacter sp.]MCX4372178.1 helix-turn-helix transcriptional regulator [Dysosmobacter sp.]